MSNLLYYLTKVGSMLYIVHCFVMHGNYDTCLVNFLKCETVLQQKMLQLKTAPLRNGRKSEMDGKSRLVYTVAAALFLQMK